MLAYDPAHWSAFLAAAVLLNLSPGPDIAFILGHTVRSGAQRGTAAMLGIWTGALCHVVLAAVGLSAVVAAGATASSVVKWVGVAYLVWLGVRALRSRGSQLLAESGSGSRSALAVFRQGVLIDLLNPEVAVFFLAFLPQFATDGAGPVWLQLGVHGVLIIAGAAIIEPPLVLLGDRLTTKARQSRALARWFDRSLGAILIALGVRLALAER